MNGDRMQSGYVWALGSDSLNLNLWSTPYWPNDFHLSVLQFAYL